MIALIIIVLIVAVISIISMWKIFEKTGRKGYISLIPIYNLWQFFVIADLKGWFSLVPVANIIMQYVAYFKLAKMFNKSTGFALVCVFFPFIGLALIAFGNDEYTGYIEEPKSEKDNVTELVYKSGVDDANVFADISDDNFDYKKVKNTKIDNGNEFNDPIVDYGIKMESTEIPDPEPEPVLEVPKENKFVTGNDSKDEFEIVEL